MQNYRHHTSFRFYIQKIAPKGSTETFPQLDIEEYFGGYYARFEGLAEDGTIANVYIENFAEDSIAKVFQPPTDEIAHETTEVTLTMLWKSNEAYEVQEQERAFYEYIKGQALIYTDTFRKKYWLLILKSRPKKVAEKLHGALQYREVSYTFTNFGGKAYDEKPTLQ